jgi:hypothetical protein
MRKERKFTLGKSNLLFIPLKFNLMQKFSFSHQQQQMAGQIFAFCLELGCNIKAYLFSVKLRRWLPF